MCACTRARTHTHTNGSTMGRGEFFPIWDIRTDNNRCHWYLQIVDLRTYVYMHYLSSSLPNLICRCGRHTNRAEDTGYPALSLLVQPLQTGSAPAPTPALWGCKCAPAHIWLGAGTWTQALPLHLLTCWVEPVPLSSGKTQCTSIVFCSQSTCI